MSEESTKVKVTVELEDSTVAWFQRVTGRKQRLAPDFVEHLMTQEERNSYVSPHAHLFGFKVCNADYRFPTVARHLMENKRYRASSDAVYYDFYEEVFGEVREAA